MAQDGEEGKSAKDKKQQCCAGWSRFSREVEKWITPFVHYRGVTDFEQIKLSAATRTTTSVNPTTTTSTTLTAWLPNRGDLLRGADFVFDLPKLWSVDLEATVQAERYRQQLLRHVVIRLGVLLPSGNVETLMSSWHGSVLDLLADMYHPRLARKPHRLPFLPIIPVVSVMWSLEDQWQLSFEFEANLLLTARETLMQETRQCLFQSLYRHLGVKGLCGHVLNYLRANNAHEETSLSPLITVVYELEYVNTETRYRLTSMNSCFLDRVVELVHVDQHDPCFAKLLATPGNTREFVVDLSALLIPYAQLLQLIFYLEHEDRPRSELLSCVASSNLQVNGSLHKYANFCTGRQQDQKGATSMCDDTHTLYRDKHRNNLSDAACHTFTFATPNEALRESNGFRLGFSPWRLDELHLIVRFRSLPPPGTRLRVFCLVLRFWFYGSDGSLQKIDSLASASQALNELKKKKKK